MGIRPRSVALGDVDGDGDLDFLTANAFSSTVSVALNQPGAVLTIVNVVDTTPPTVTSIDDGDADNVVIVGTTLTYTVTFSEDIQNGTVTATDFDNAGTATITIGAIAETSAGVFTVAVTPTTTGTVQLRIPNGAVISDLAGNNLVVPVLDGDTITVNPVPDTTPPTVVTIDDGDADNTVIVGTALTYTITFSEDIDGTTVTAADFDNAGTATITIGAIAETSAGVFTVAVTPTTTGSVQLQIPTGAVISDLAGNNLVVPVVDDDTVTVTSPVVTISAVDDTANETAQDPGTFRITRTGATTNNLTVSYTIGGTGVNGTDYNPTLTGSAVIPNGNSFVDLTITPVNDNLDEQNETVILTLTDTADYDLGTLTTATITITDDDPAPTLTIGDATVTEGGIARFTATLSNPSAFTTSANFSTIGGSATSPTDFDATSGTVIFALNAKLKTTVAKIDRLRAEIDTIVAEIEG